MVRFLDHVQEFDSDDETMPSGPIEPGQGPLKVEVRGKVVRVDDTAVTVDGSWSTTCEVCFGRFTILRSAVQTIEPLRR